MHLRKRTVEIFNKFTFGLNFTTIILGIIYSFLAQQYILVIFFTFILIATWLCNICLILIDDFKLNKNTSIGKKLNLTGYLFLLIQIVSVFLLVGGLFLLNANWASLFFQYILIYLGFYSFFVFGIIFSLYNLFNLKHLEVWNFE